MRALTRFIGYLWLDENRRSQSLGPSIRVFSSKKRERKRKNKEDAFAPCSNRTLRLELKSSIISNEH